jgi:hypothetical protein
MNASASTFNGFDIRKYNIKISAICWSVTAILLSFLCLTNLFVILSFLFGWNVSAAVAPVAVIIAIITCCVLGKREGLQSWQRIVPALISLCIIGIALLLASAFYDFSWDGLWYHQTAVYQMSHGWNPIYDPLHRFAPNVQTWLRFYAKGPWYTALALFESTHNIEMAKAAPWIAFTSTFFAVFAASIDFGMGLRKAAVIAALIVLNPVIICELASYLVDGLMISFLACFIAAMFRWFRRSDAMIIWIAAASSILCINSKFTGLVYITFFCAAGGLYVIIKRRDLFLRFSAIIASGCLLGILFFGFNPYLTNTLKRGNPFFPILGSAEYPSLSQRGLDPIERFETPHNFLGRNRFLRFAYAVFGRPGAQPYFPGENAILMWPFDIGWKDFDIFYFHDVRISGFGPLFSGALLIGVFLLCIAFMKSSIPKETIIIFSGIIILSVLISMHTWWARYGPQLWWLPVFAVITGFIASGFRTVRFIAYGLAAILMINSILITVCHFRWEIDATRTEHEQMTLMRQAKEVVVDLQDFREPFGERLRNERVKFTEVQGLNGDSTMELMTVTPGYPGAVRAFIKNH